MFISLTGWRSSPFSMVKPIRPKEKSPVVPLESPPMKVVAAAAERRVHGPADQPRADPEMAQELAGRRGGPQRRLQRQRRLAPQGQGIAAVATPWKKARRFKTFIGSP
jgi:hypothetical protein